MSAQKASPIHVRVSVVERDRIETLAGRAGLKFSEYVRQAALGILEPSPSSTAPKPKAALPASSPARGKTSMAERVDREDVAAEVAEATQLDDVAHESFLERRTRQLVGQGKTTKVARSLAEAEWRQRGVETGPAAA